MWARLRMANPNPSPATRFKPGQSGNPSGKSTEQLKAENAASLIAANLTLAALSSLQEKLEAEEIRAHELITADVMRFIKEAQDRAHGTPKQSQEISGPDRGPIVTEDRSVEKLKAFLDIHAERNRASSEPPE